MCVLAIILAIVKECDKTEDTHSESPRRNKEDICKQQ